MEEKPVLSVQGISRFFRETGIQACSDISFDLYAGEILVLMGDNGSGKSTLVRILAGLEKADRGEVFHGPSLIHLHHPSDSIKAGIGIIRQVPEAVSGMTLGDMVIAGLPGLPLLMGKKKRIEYLKIQQKRWGISLPFSLEAHGAPLRQRQTAELLHWLIRGSRILLLDEPVSLLEEAYRDDFTLLIKSLATEGYSILLITHKRDEGLALASRVLTLSHGRVSKNDITFKAEVSDNPMVSGSKSAVDVAAPFLEVFNLPLKHLQTADFIFLSFQLHPGEILAISTREEELLHQIEAFICGQEKVPEGTIKIDGIPIPFWTSGKFRKLPGRCLPLHPMVNGASLENTLSENLFPVCSSSPFLSEIKVKLIIQQMKKFLFFQGDFRTPLRTLSGGHRKRFVAARELSGFSRLLVLGEPSREMDMASQNELFRKIRQRANEGTAVLLLTSNRDEREELAECVISLG